MLTKLKTSLKETAADSAAAAAAEDINFLKRDYEALAKHRPSPSNLKKLLLDPDFFKLPLGANSLNQAKRLDKILGFKIPKIEQKLLKKYQSYFHGDESGRKKRFEGSQTWIGLHPQVLQTPYSEILSFCEILKEFNPKTIVDIGAAYGRIGIVMTTYFPEAKFIGYELIPQRLEEANRMFEVLELHNCCMIEEDLSKESFTPPAADVYFIYDFSDPLDIRKILTQVKEATAGKQAFIIAKGEFIQPIIRRKYPEFVSILPEKVKMGWDIFKLG